MTIVIVEDDHIIRESLVELLSTAGYDTRPFACLKDARLYLHDHVAPSLLLLDIMLPDGSGLAFCREIRDTENTPVICITALDDEDSIVAGLSAGADDYITKPFRARELLARVEANLRRTVTYSNSLISGPLLFDRLLNKLSVHGQDLSLRATERELLILFLESRGRLLTRDYLLYRLWDSKENYVEENTLSVSVSRLRKTLQDCGVENCIETIRGVGYRWLLPIRNTGAESK